MEPSIGQQLRSLREKAGLSRTEAANLAGIAVSTLWRWEERKPSPHSRQLLRDYETLLAGLLNPPPLVEASRAAHPPPRLALETSPSLLLTREEEDSKTVLSFALRSLAARHNLTQSGLAQVAEVGQSACPTLTIEKGTKRTSLLCKENLE